MKDGNIVQFVSKMKGITEQEAMNELGIFNKYNNEYTLEDYAKEKHFEIEHLLIWGVTNTSDYKRIAINYRNRKGEIVAVRYRNNPENRYLPRFTWSEGAQLTIYGEWMIDMFPDEYVIICEGESDCHALWSDDFMAVGIPGAKNFKKEYAKFFKRFKKIYIHSEEDSGAELFIEQISRYLPKKKLYIISSSEVNEYCKDPSDLHVRELLNKDTLLATAKKLEEVEVKEHVELAEEVLSQMHIKFYKENFYIYRDGVYIEGLSAIEKCIQSININARKALQTEVLNYIRIKTSLDEDYTIDKNLINFKNGIFNIKDNMLYEHTPEIFTTCQINAAYLDDEEFKEYIENKKNQYIDAFIEDVCCNNELRKIGLLEFVGYSMTYDVSLEKCLFLWGSTAGNGKSTFIKLVTKMIGKNNYCSLPIENFSDRFSGSEIVNKLLNIVHEVSNIKLSDIAKFKAIVSGDELSVEEKYKSRYKITPTCHHIFAMNKLPEVYGCDDEGYFRRIHIIKFEAKFSDEEKEKFDFDNLVSSESINYFANQSLRRYLKMKEEHKRKFSSYRESDEILEKYRNKYNSARDFIEDTSFYLNNLNENNSINRTDLYKLYQIWTIENNIPTMDKKQFYDEISKSGMFVPKKLDGYSQFKYLKSNN